MEQAKLLKLRKLLKNSIIKNNDYKNSIYNILFVVSDKEYDLKNELVKLLKYLNKKDEMLQYFYNELTNELRKQNIKITGIEELIKYELI